MTQNACTLKKRLKLSMFNICSLIHHKGIMSRTGYRVSLQVATILLLALSTARCSTQVNAESNMRAIPDYLASEELQAAKGYRKVLPTVVTIYTSQRILKQGGQLGVSAVAS